MLLLMLGIIAAGCNATPSAPAEETAIVRDSAGVRIVENSGPADASRVPRLEAEPFVRIGSVDGAEQDLLHRVRHVIRLTGGVIVVADGGTQQIRLFNESGAHLRSIGGQGDGPAEFQSISYMRRLAGDSVLIFDNRHRRITILAADGTHARDYVPYASDGTPQMVMGALPDRTLLVYAPGGGDPAPHTLQFTRGTFRVAVQPPGGELMPLRPYASSDIQVEAGTPRPGVYSTRVMTVPYSRQAFTTTAGDRFVIGANESYEAHFYDGTGSLATVVRSAHVPVRPVDDAALAEYVDASVAAAERRALDGGRQYDAAAARANYVVSPHAPSVPTYAGLLGAESGDLWVKEYAVDQWSETPDTWDVFDADGVFRHSIELPIGFTPLYIDDEVVLGTFADDLGVEYLHGYSLVSG
ncbi:MAG: hypothetical protein WD054_04910 [Gemmatimonadota bacterium]